MLLFFFSFFGSEIYSYIFYSFFVFVCRSDLGSEVGFEATGRVEADLPTVGVWAKKSDEVSSYMYTYHVTSRMVRLYQMSQIVSIKHGVVGLVRETVRLCQ